jgi:hypothetical protein
MLLVETSLPIEAAIEALREICDEFEKTSVELKCRIGGLRLLGFVSRWGPSTVLQFFPEETLTEGEYSIDVARGYLEKSGGEAESLLRLLAERLGASFAAVALYPLSFFAGEFEGTLQERMLEDPCEALPVLLKRGAPSMLAYVLLSLLHAREILDLDYEHLRGFQAQIKCIEERSGCAAATDAQLAEELTKSCNEQIKVITQASI